MRVLLKREDLTHTGSHKINNVLGQALLTRRMGKQRVIAETGAGQHGVATATAAALFGLDCTVFMGAVDVERQALNVWRMRLLGAEVDPGRVGERDAQGRDQRRAARLGRDASRRTHYCIGSVVGPHPYPWIVREFQRIVGDEAREQCRAILGGDDPDVVVACVGGGSNAIGTFAGFLDTDARLVGVEAGGLGLESGQHGASVEPWRSRRAARRALAVPPGRGRARSSRRTRSARGSTTRASVPSTPRSRRAGGPSTTSATDDEALAGFELLAATEGIVPALEPAHAIGWLAREAGHAVPQRRRRCSSRSRAGATRTRRRSPSDSRREASP